MLLNMDADSYYCQLIIGDLAFVESLAFFSWLVEVSSVVWCSTEVIPHSIQGTGVTFYDSCRIQADGNLLFSVA